MQNARRPGPDLLVIDVNGGARLLRTGCDGEFKKIYSFKLKM